MSKPEWCLCPERQPGRPGWCHDYDCNCPHHSSTQDFDHIPFYIDVCRVCRAYTPSMDEHLDWHVKTGTLK